MTTAAQSAAGLAERETNASATIHAQAPAKNSTTAARERLVTSAATMIVAAIPKSEARIFFARKFSCVHARARMPLTAKKFPVWLRLGNGPKPRSECQNGTADLK